MMRDRSNKMFKLASRFGLAALGLGVLFVAFLGYTNPSMALLLEKLPFCG